MSGSFSYKVAKGGVRLIKNINISGIDISIEKKKIKNMYIKVLPPDGRVQISAPISFSEETISTFATSRIEWIKKHRNKFGKHPRKEEYKYETGEIHYLWGKPYPLEVVYSNTLNDIYICDEKIILKVRENSTLEHRVSLMDSWYREILKNAIPPVFEQWEKLIGVKATEWRVKKMRTRWGTCNINAKRVWLSLELVKKAPQCLEYVIIHELVHLLEKSHNHIFKAYMDKFYPHWQMVRASLNE